MIIMILYASSVLSPYLFPPPLALSPTLSTPLICYTPVPGGPTIQASGGSLDKMSNCCLVSTRLDSLRPSSATACPAVLITMRGGVTQWTLMVVAGPTNLQKYFS
jgi:hypothetical protein